MQILYNNLYKNQANSEELLIQMVVMRIMKMIHEKTIVLALKVRTGVKQLTV